MSELINPATRFRLHQQQRRVRALLGDLRQDAGSLEAQFLVEQLDALFTEHISLVEAVLEAVTTEER